MTTSEISDYALGAGEAERARLLAQCEIHRAEAEHLVDRIGVAPGWRTIDIGCGPLGVLDILAGREIRIPDSAKALVDGFESYGS